MASRDDPSDKQSIITPLPVWLGECCSVHGGFQLNTYCEDCKELICVKCLLSDHHKGHQGVPADEKDKELRSIFAEAIQGLEKQLDTCEDTSMKLATTFDDVKDCSNKELCRIWDGYVKAGKRLNKQYNVITAKVEKDFGECSLKLRQEFRTAVQEAKTKWNKVSDPLKAAMKDSQEATGDSQITLIDAKALSPQAQMPEVVRKSEEVKKATVALPDHSTLASADLPASTSCPTFTSEMNMVVEDLGWVSSMKDAEEKKKNEEVKQSRLRVELGKLVPTSPRSRPKWQTNGEADDGDIAVLEKDRQAWLRFSRGGTDSPPPPLTWLDGVKPLLYCNNTQSDVAFLSPDVAGKISKLVGGISRLTLSNTGNKTEVLVCFDGHTEYIDCNIMCMDRGEMKNGGTWFLPLGMNLKECVATALGFSPSHVEDYRNNIVEMRQSCAEWSKSREGFSLYAKK